LDRPVVEHLDPAKADKVNVGVLGGGLRVRQANLGRGPSKTGISEAVVPAASLESWIPRSLAGLTATEERLKRSIEAVDDILEDLGVHRGQVGTRLAPQGDVGLLLVAGRNPFLPLLPRFFALGEAVVVQAATRLKSRI
jgi:hypothetical protein